MNNYYLNINALPISHQPPIKSGSPNITPFSPVGTIQQPPNYHPQALRGVFSGQMHEVVLEHLRVNDEVVWHPQGQILSINKLDIGRIERTFYHVDHSNQGALLADVDFHDWVEGSQEVRSPHGHRAFRRRVYAKDLKKLGEFLESVNSHGIGLVNWNNAEQTGHQNINKSSHEGALTQNHVGVKAYVIRPCMVQNKRPTTHPLISESDLIFVFLNNIVVKGSVKRMFIGDENYFIGAEFERPVYTRQLHHDASCAYSKNGCEFRICILLSNLTKQIWDQEFRLIGKGTMQITFENLFYQEEPPPPYSVATSMPMLPISQPTNNMSLLPTPASAPPLTPSPPLSRSTEKWTKFESDGPNFHQTQDYSSEQQQDMGSLSKNYSASMMNLDSCGVHEENNSSLSHQRPKVTPKYVKTQSLLVDELQRKLNIRPKTEVFPISDPPQISGRDMRPQHSGDVRQEIPTTELMPLNSTSTSFLEELQRRQATKNRPASMGPQTTLPREKLPQRNSLPPPRRPASNSVIHDKIDVPDSVEPASSLSISRSAGTSFGTGMTRSTSCFNISETKPPLKPRPTLAPKPVKVLNSGNNKFSKVEIISQVEPPNLPPVPQRPKSHLDQASSIIPQEPKSSSLLAKNSKENPPETKLPIVQQPPQSQVQRPTSFTQIIEEYPMNHWNPRHSQNAKARQEVLPPIKSKLYPDLESAPRPMSVELNPKIIHPPIIDNAPSYYSNNTEQITHSNSQSPAPPFSPRLEYSPSKVPEIYQEPKNLKISRENLPPPPPPPPPPIDPQLSADVRKDDLESFPPPPTEWLDANDDNHFKNSADDFSDISAQKPRSEKHSSPPQPDRGCLLQQIRRGTKLRPVRDNSDLLQIQSEAQTSKSEGFENIIKGAIATRRVMLDSDDDDDEDSNGSDYDEDSDAWD